MLISYICRWKFCIMIYASTNPKFYIKQGICRDETKKIISFSECSLNDEQILTHLLEFELFFFEKGGDWEKPNVLLSRCLLIRMI